MSDFRAKWDPTLRQVAEALGMHISSVSRLRRGKQAPSWATMRRIAEVYGWSISSQAASREAGRYALGLELHLQKDPK